MSDQEQEISSSLFAKKRHKVRDERKRVLKICVNKLQNIQDPESYLCKSVLINNTLKQIQKEHRDSQKRNKLKRQSSCQIDEVESKRIHIENFEHHHDIDEDLHDQDDDVRLDDVTSPLNSAYYDVDSYKSDTLDEVILCDNATATAIDDDHVWCPPEQQEQDSNNNADETIPHNSVDISVEKIECSVIAQESEINENSFHPQDFSNRGCCEKFQESLIHNNSISLQT